MPWTIGQFPELDHLEPAERAVVLRRVPWWTYPLILVRVTLGALPLASVVAVLSLYQLRQEFAALLFVVVAAGAAVGLYAYELRSLRRVVRREVAEGFRGARPPFCFACGYDLRASGDALCPECGRSVVATPVE